MRGFGENWLTWPFEILFTSSSSIHGSIAVDVCTREVTYEFRAGSMGPKVKSVVEFLEQNVGHDVDKIMSRQAGTQVTTAHEKDDMRYYQSNMLN